MCDQDQTEAFVSPGYDENLHACSVCLDSGLSMKDQSYCECEMGDKLCKFDAYAISLSRHSAKDALRIVFRATTKTEKARAAAEQAMLIAGHQRAIKTMTDGFERERNALLARIATLQANVTAAEARAFEMSGKPGAVTTPRYSNVTDHRGRITGIRLDNPEDMPSYTSQAVTVFDRLRKMIAGMRENSEVFGQFSEEIARSIMDAVSDEIDVVESEVAALAANNLNQEGK